MIHLGQKKAGFLKTNTTLGLVLIRAPHLLTPTQEAPLALHLTPHLIPCLAHALHWMTTALIPCLMI